MRDQERPQPFGAAAIFVFACGRVHMPSFRMVVIFCAATTSAAVCIAALRANEAVDFWRDEWLRQHPSNATQAPSRQKPANATPVSSQPRAAARPKSAIREPTVRAKLTVWPKRREAKNHEAAKPKAERVGAGGGSVYCVRTCDGYYFPANAGGSSAENSKICNALCPGAATEAYRLGKNDAIEDALSSKGKPYASLPAAFSYRTGLKEGCACGPRARTGFAALLEDSTLAPSDIVVTETGIRVFVGGAKFPYRESEFVPYRKVRGMERGLAAYLDSIDHPLSHSK
jgi:hypothetical protein